jgi:hypothetical protein
MLAGLFSVPVFVLANPNSSIEKRWNSHAGEWVITQKIDYAYSKEHAGKPTEELHYFWNSYINDWSQTQKVIFDYDVKGRLLTTTTYNYYAPSSSWKPNSKSECQYEKNKTTTLIYKYNNYANRTTEWDIDKKTVTVLSKKQKQTEETFRWIADKEEWELAEKRSFKYNSAGLPAYEHATPFYQGESYGFQEINYTYGLNNYVVEKEIKDNHGGKCDHGGKFAYEYN